MQNQDSQPKVTVEDLLRLKRAERPSAEFWSRFERELRQKQLAALLQKRPWWQDLPRWIVRHAYLPMGATAALAFAFVASRNQSVSSLATGETVPTVSSTHSAPTAPVASEPLEDLAVLEAPTPLNTPETPPVESSAIAMTVPGDVGERLPWSAPRTIETPSAQSIAATLAQLAETEPELLETVRGTRLVASSPRLQPTAERAVMELASVSVNSSTPRRNNRLLVGFEQRDFSPEPAAPDQIRERIARRLGDQDLIDDVRRLDLKGDRLSLKL